MRKCRAEYSLIRNRFKLLLATALMVFVLSDHSALFSAPNYYYSAANYCEYQSQKELEKEDSTRKIEAYLKKPVPGLSASYKDVIDALIANGFEVYLRGGVVRDVLSIASIEPNDVDLDYTSTPQALMKICRENHWRYTHFENRSLVVIGDFRSGSIEAMPVMMNEEVSDEGAMEFTINNIFYHCNTKSFLKNSEAGLQDLSCDRMFINADDWMGWLYKRDRPYYKIFRFWKMIGKGYIYSDKLQQFFEKEVEKILAQKKEVFHEELVTYLSGHYSSFDEVYHGSVAAMGYKWAQENVMKIKKECKKRDLLLEKEKELRTVFP